MKRYIITALIMMAAGLTHAEQWHYDPVNETAVLYSGEDWIVYWDDANSNCVDSIISFRNKTSDADTNGYVPYGGDFEVVVYPGGDSFTSENVGYSVTNGILSISIPMRPDLAVKLAAGSYIKVNVTLADEVLTRTFTLKGSSSAFARTYEACKASKARAGSQWKSIPRTQPRPSKTHPNDFTKV